MANYHPNLSPTQKQLLDLVPLQARVKITRPNGTARFVSVNQVTPTDHIETKPDGTPVVMHGLPGRPAKSAVQAIPAAQQASNHNFKNHQSKHAAIARDPLVRLAQVNPDAKSVADQLLQEATEELAALKYERQAAEQRGESSYQLSVKRIASLVQLSNVWLKRFDSNLGSGQVDLASPGVKALINFLIETFRDALDQSGMPQSGSDGVLAKMTKMMDASWTVEAEARIKSSIGG